MDGGRGFQACRKYVRRPGVRRDDEHSQIGKHRDVEPAQRVPDAGGNA